MFDEQVDMFDEKVNMLDEQVNMFDVFEVFENVDFSWVFRKCFPVPQEVVGIKNRPGIKF